MCRELVQQPLLADAVDLHLRHLCKYLNQNLVNELVGHVVIHFREEISVLTSPATKNTSSSMKATALGRPPTSTFHRVARCLSDFS